MIWTNGALTVRKLVDSDEHYLVKWLSDERVLEHYEGRDKPHDLCMVRERYMTKRGNPVTGCIVEYEETAIGYIQFYPSTDSEKIEYGYRVEEPIYGIDQFIGEPDYWGKGLGVILVREMVNYLINHKHANKVIMNPRVDNIRAIKCYEKSGFVRVRMLPKCEMHEGQLRDCWLMEY